MGKQEIYACGHLYDMICIRRKYLFVVDDFKDIICLVNTFECFPISFYKPTTILGGNSNIYKTMVW